MPPLSQKNNNKKEPSRAPSGKKPERRLWLLILLALIPILILFIFSNIQLPQSLVRALVTIVAVIYFFSLLFVVFYFFKLLYDYLKLHQDRIKKDKQYLLYSFLIMISSMLVWLAFIFI